MERVWAFPSAAMPSLAGTEKWKVLELLCSLGYFMSLQHTLRISGKELRISFYVLPH